MKKFMLLAGITLLMAASAVFVSCKSDDDDGGTYIGYYTTESGCKTAAGNKGYTYACYNKGKCYGGNSKFYC